MQNNDNNKNNNNNDNNNNNNNNDSPEFAGTEVGQNDVLLSERNTGKLEK